MPTWKASGVRSFALAFAALAVLAASSCAFSQEDDAGRLSGFFEVAISSTQTEPLTVEEIAFNVSYALRGLSASVDATFTETTFDTLSFAATGAVGEIDVSSNVTFNPSTIEFLSWQAAASFTFLGLDVSDLLHVTAPQTASYTSLTVAGDAGPFTFEVATKFGICPLALWETSLCADWPWDDCGTTLGACIQVTDTAGVQAVDFTMSDYVLFENLLGMLWSLDVALSFTPEAKTLTPTLSLQPDWLFCEDLEILGEVSGGAPLASVDTIMIYGLRGEFAVGESTTIRFADSLTDDKNSAMTGKADYFELIEISGAFPACCDSTASFELAAYFERPPAPSGALFGLGLFTGSVDFQIGPGFGVSVDAEFPTSGSAWKILWGIQVFW